jgi:hypothetical protein
MVTRSPETKRVGEGPNQSVNNLSPLETRGRVIDVHRTKPEWDSHSQTAQAIWEVKLLPARNKERRKNS